MLLAYRGEEETPRSASPNRDPKRQLERSGASAVVGSRNLILMPKGQWIRASDSAADINVS
ncbi:hypothetical protein ACMD2_22698 [Ananas comosus]|uniref:Uncharacterized protein n=1 Tax=Ananas comosus TaxID=4615 RepID=A0A199UYL6_ANACO|nr:hypothetical protein ACMD2_22698 [Ananas comosus]